MRIIGGTHKRKTLAAVPGMTTRPTSDRLRESLFNILQNRIAGSHALDLFAGTGALGLEALSRGACDCVFVDHQKEALSVIEKNIRACALESRCRIRRWDIRQNLNVLRNHIPPFDLVFIDPPYGQGLIHVALAHLVDTQCLAAHALLVCEHATADGLTDLPSDMVLSDQRRYGKTTLSFLSAGAVNAGDEAP
jgi:16S rRNA (guanine966-N2)-methyltransferase